MKKIVGEGNGEEEKDKECTLRGGNSKKMENVPRPGQWRRHRGELGKVTGRNNRKRRGRKKKAKSGKLSQAAKNLNKRQANTRNQEKEKSFFRKGRGKAGKKSIAPQKKKRPSEKRFGQSWEKVPKDERKVLQRVTGTFLEAPNLNV